MILIPVFSGLSQVPTRFYDAPKSLTPSIEVKQYAVHIPTMKLPAVNVEKLLDEASKRRGSAHPFRFGKGFKVGYSLKQGNWSAGLTLSR